MQQLLKSHILRSAGYRRSALAFYLLYVALALGAQDFVETDRETYQLYLDKQWEQLIKKGKEALSGGLDYYYLRMRIGIANYELKDYKAAQVHFRKALIFNEDDPVAYEYLYYSYLFAGQVQQAAILYKRIPDERRSEMTDPGLRAFDRIGLEYFYNQTNADKLLEDPATFLFVEDPYKIITRHFHNVNFSLSHAVYPGIYLTHAYTYLDKSNFYHYNDGVDSFGVDGIKVWQHQYYFNPMFTTGGGLVISPSFHYLSVKYQVPFRVSSGTPGMPGSGGQQGPSPGGGYFARLENRLDQYAAGLSIMKFTGKFRLRFGSVYSNLNFKEQLTASAGLIWYPLGNLNAYLGGSLNAHSPDIQNREFRWIQDIVLGYGIASRVWMEITATGGHMRNYTESNVYLVYNGLDWIRYKVTGSFTVPFTRKGSSVYLGGRYAEYTNDFKVFAPPPRYGLVDVSYGSWSVYGGISLKF